jgi:hypothetical protein
VQKFAVLSAYFGAKGKATVEYCIEYRHWILFLPYDGLICIYFVHWFAIFTKVIHK